MGRNRKTEETEPEIRNHSERNRTPNTKTSFLPSETKQSIMIQNMKLTRNKENVPNTQEVESRNFITCKTTQAFGAESPHVERCGDENSSVQTNQRKNKKQNKTKIIKQKQTK